MMVKVLNKLLLLFVCSFVALSCSTMSRKKPPVKAPPSANDQLSAIEKQIKAGDLIKGYARLDQFVITHKDTDIADDANLMGGEEAVKRNDYDRAFTYFMNVVNSEVYSPEEGRALMLAADSLLKLGRFDEAVALTDRGLDYRNLPKSVELKLYELRYKILTQLGDRLDAFQALVYLTRNEQDNNKIDAYKLKALDHLESTLNEKELYYVANSSSFGEYRANAFFKLGQQAFEQRFFDKAKNYLDHVIDLSAETDLGEQAGILVEQIEARRKVDPKAIGAILPLSGRHAPIAQKTLRGLQLGLGIFGSQSPEFKLAIIDSEGNPDAARRAVERLVTEDHVIAIVGSLLSRTAVAVASKSNELGVPSIALSQKSGITEVGDYVYRNALTSEMQVKELVRIAMEERGLKRFAILYPNDRYGAEYANLFWDNVKARGGSIAAAQFYENNETDFSGPIERLVGKFYLEDRLSEYKFLVRDWFSKQNTLSMRISPPDDLLKPIVDFDAVFIPDNTKALGQIAPMLAYHDIQGITLLGTNLWNTPSLIARGQKLVEGAVFVDSLLASDSEFLASDFYQNYLRTFGEKPGIFESQGYDAGLLLRQLILGGVNTRVSIKERLDNTVNFPGSIGSIGTNSRRELTRPVVKLGVQGGEIVLRPKAPEKTTTK